MPVVRLSGTRTFEHGSGTRPACCVRRACDVRTLHAGRGGKPLRTGRRPLRHVSRRTSHSGYAVAALRRGSALPNADQSRQARYRERPRAKFRVQKVTHQGVTEALETEASRSPRSSWTALTGSRGDDSEGNGGRDSAAVSRREMADRHDRHAALIDVNYSCSLATTIFAEPEQVDGTPRRPRGGPGGWGERSQGQG